MVQRTICMWHYADSFFVFVYQYVIYWLLRDGLQGNAQLLNEGRQCLHILQSLASNLSSQLLDSSFGVLEHIPSIMRVDSVEQVVSLLFADKVLDVEDILDRCYPVVFQIDLLDVELGLLGNTFLLNHKVVIQFRCFRYRRFSFLLLHGL